MDDADMQKTAVLMQNCFFVLLVKVSLLYGRLIQEKTNILFCEERDLCEKLLSGISCHSHCRFVNAQKLAVNGYRIDDIQALIKLRAVLLRLFLKQPLCVLIRGDVMNLRDEKLGLPLGRTDERGA
jgi:hypothetical protein